MCSLYEMLVGARAGSLSCESCYSVSSVRIGNFQEHMFGLVFCGVMPPIRLRGLDHSEKHCGRNCLLRLAGVAAWGWVTKIHLLLRVE